MERNEMLDNDVTVIANTVQGVLDVSLNDITSIPRLEQDKYVAKVAFCRLLRERGYGYGTIAQVMHTTKSGVYKLVRKHHAMIDGDTLYRRTYEILKKRLS